MHDDQFIDGGNIEGEVSEVKHETFALARDQCAILASCTGIDYNTTDKNYQLRKGSDIKSSSSGGTAWFKMG